MEISNDNKKIKEVQQALDYYIDGITIDSKHIHRDSNFMFTIQRITERALVKYTVIDKKQENYLEIVEINIKKENININLSNLGCKYAKEIRSIEIEIPYLIKDENSTKLILDKNVKIKVL